MRRDIEYQTYMRDRSAQARAAASNPDRHRHRKHFGRRLAALGERTAAGALWLVLLLATVLLIGGALAVTEGLHIMAGGESVGQKIDRGIGRINAMFADTGARIEDNAQAVRDRADHARQAALDRVDAAGAAVRRQGEAIHEGVSDTAITASIKADLLKDPYLSAAKVDVDVAGGVVTLSGTAASDASRERAGRMAAAVAGVKQVNNQLAVAAATAAR